MKKYLKVILFFTICFAITMIFSNVKAADTNYNKYRDMVDATNIYSVSMSTIPEADITDELVGLLNKTNPESSTYEASVNGYYMIYIPSGSYVIGDDNNMVIHSNTYFILEDDTELIKKANTSNSLLRTRGTENPENITIYGGVFNGNTSGKYVLEIMNAKNVKIENTTIKNSSSGNHGISINNSTVNIVGAKIFDNSNVGLYLRESETVATVKNSKIYNNANGIYATAGATLYANDNANNEVYSNKENGVYVNGAKAAYLNKNTIKKNGNHGIYVNKTTANIDDVSVFNNKNSGIYLRDEGTSVTVKNSKIYNNENGIYVAAGSKLYANDNANNQIYDNDVNGISVNGKSSNGVKSEA
jgi:hypothetical protein